MISDSSGASDHVHDSLSCDIMCISCNSAGYVSSFKINLINHASVKYLKNMNVGKL